MHVKPTSNGSGVLGAGDLGACERERIHAPGAIQPHGCLLSCTLSAWTVTSVSANAGEYFGREASSLLGVQLDGVLPHKVLHDVRNVLQSAMVSGSAERLADVRIDESDIRYDLTVHVAGTNALIEILPRAGAEVLTADPVILVRSMIGRLKRAPSLDRFLKLAASQVRAVTGFDRVMIYKFLQDGSGEVVAESLRSGMPPFLGLRYPASDIPAQARALYKRQWLRLIPDVVYTPVPLLTLSASDEEVDLSLAALRSVSPLHLEYLCNMGTRATLTVSLMAGDELWGLIACHHDSPRRISSATCVATELFGQIFSLQIEAKEQARELDDAACARAAQRRLLASMPADDSLFDNLARFHPLLAELIPCDGIGIWSEKGYSGVGSTPPQHAIAELIQWLGEKPAAEPFATHSLSALLPATKAYSAEVSGVLAIPFSRSSRDYLMFFRREVVQTVTWGGDPNKPVDVTDAEHRISPRKSFDAWRETVRGTSLPWSAAELQIAEALRVSLLEVFLQRTDTAVRERKLAEESQAFLIAELNHRVKNILALIRSVVRQSRQGAKDVGDFADDLEQRVHAMAVAHDQLTSTGWKNAPLRKLLEAEAKAWTHAPNRITFEGPPVTLDSRAFQTLALVFHEMMTNAAKYGSLSSPAGRLSITWSRNTAGNLSVEWRERGGPPVEAPGRRGFGSVVVEQTIPFELGGQARVEYAAEGVVGRFMVPAVHVGQGENDSNVVAAEAQRPDASLRRLLLVEDSMMIALDAQATLGDAGLDVEVAGTSADARRALDETVFDAAVLDINLSGEMSFGVADDLMRLGTPFVFATGYGESIVIPDRFKTVPIVSKPYNEAALRTALGTTKKSHGSVATTPVHEAPGKAL